MSETVPPEQMRALVAELAQALEDAINRKFGMEHGQVSLSPRMQRRYLKEMDLVKRARAALSEQPA